MMDALRIHQYRKAQREIEQAVKDGKIFREDADKRLIGMRKAMFPPAGNGDADLEARKRRYMEAQRKIEKLVKDGKLSREDAEKKLIALRKKMFG
jgi:polyhydroxyalkanoate synthesis regulator phasin